MIKYFISFIIRSSRKSVKMEYLQLEFAMSVLVRTTR